MQSDVLFENEACVVINKRCGEDSERPEGFSGLRPVHRLDKPASGCLLLAKTVESAKNLSAQFPLTQFQYPDFSSGPAGNVQKRYWAVVEKPEKVNLINGEWKEAVHWLGFSQKQNKSFAHNAEKPGAKKAVLRFRMIGSGENYLFLEIDLVTGRHHQIRAQLAALGIHIKGDLKYGARRSEKSGGIRLHARSLGFPNPLDKDDYVIVEAPVPIKDALWEAFMSLINSSDL